MKLFTKKITRKKKKKKKERRRRKQKALQILSSSCADWEWHLSLPAGGQGGHVRSLKLTWHVLSWQGDPGQRRGRLDWAVKLRLVSSMWRPWTWLDLTWLGLAWLGLGWLILTYLDFTWLVLTWLGLAWLDWHETHILCTYLHPFSCWEKHIGRQIEREAGWTQLDHGSGPYGPIEPDPRVRWAGPSLWVKGGRTPRENIHSKIHRSFVVTLNICPSTCILFASTHAFSLAPFPHLDVFWFGWRLGRLFSSHGTWASNVYEH